MSESSSKGTRDAAGGSSLGAVGEQGTTTGRARPDGVPDPELTPRAKRRSFTAEYKTRIVAEADACTEHGQIGELLRREGLYSSHLEKWRAARDRGALKEFDRPRGRKPVDKRDQQITALTRRAERAEAELVKMKRVVEIQGNVSALLAEMLGQGSAQGSTER